MRIKQIIVIVSLLATLYSWIRNRPSKLLSSSFLLLIFVVFGGTPLEKIFSFPLSPSFTVIVLSFVFSQGIINSGLTEKFIEPYISRYSSNRYKFLLFLLLVIFVLSWLIPQPFSRAVLIAMVFSKYFREIGLDKRVLEILLFGVFAFSVVINTFFKEVDIILNRALITISGVDIGSLQWIKLLFFPGLGVLFLVVLAFSVIFKRELELLEKSPSQEVDISVNRDDWINLGIIVLTVLLWISEGIHGIDGAILVGLGIVAMYFRGILRFKDLKSINLELLVFLTASFSIGNVMMGSGIAGGLFTKLSSQMPQVFSLKFVLVVSVTTMIFHMILGSSVTTMSVVIPSFFSVVIGIKPELVMMIILISLYIQYILPIHNALMSVGVGNNFFGNGPVFRFGLACSFITLVAIYLIYIPWWKLIGFI